MSDKSQVSSLHLVVDSDRLHLAASGAIWGQVWLSWGEGSFPAAEWEDIVVDIVESMAMALRGLSPNGFQEVRFPDGSYRATFRSIDQTSYINVRLDDYVTGDLYGEITTELIEMIKSVDLCAKQLLNECEGRGWSGWRVDRLRQTVSRLT